MQQRDNFAVFWFSSLGPCALCIPIWLNYCTKWLICRHQSLNRRHLSILACLIPKLQCASFQPQLCSEIEIFETFKPAVGLLIVSSMCHCNGIAEQIFMYERGALARHNDDIDDGRERKKRHQTSDSITKERNRKKTIYTNAIDVLFVWSRSNRHYFIINFQTMNREKKKMKKKWQKNTPSIE